MRIEQVSGAHLLDVKKIILRGDFTQRHDLNAVRFPVRGVEKQVFKIPEAFRVAHRGAERLDVGAALRRVGHVHYVTRMRAVLVILATKQRGGLIQPGGIERAQVFRHPVELLIDIGLKQMAHRTGGELMRVRIVRHVPVTGAACRSTLVSFIKRQQWPQACDQLTRWVYVNGEVNKGLENRRARERAYCLRGIQ